MNKENKKAPVVADVKARGLFMGVVGPLISYFKKGVDPVVLEQLNLVNLGLIVSIKKQLFLVLKDGENKNAIKVDRLLDKYSTKKPSKNDFEALKNMNTVLSDLYKELDKINKDGRKNPIEIRQLQADIALVLEQPKLVSALSALPDAPKIPAMVRSRQKIHEKKDHVAPVNNVKLNRRLVMKRWRDQQLAKLGPGDDEKRREINDQFSRNVRSLYEKTPPVLQKIKERELEKNEKIEVEQQQQAGKKSG
jgi:hypothetical protein